MDDPGGDFFPRLWAVLGELDSVAAATALVGAASIVALVVLRRRAPAVPGILIVLVASIAASALLHLSSHGVDVVGELPSALPKPGLPDVAWSDVGSLVATAFGVAGGRTQLASLIAAVLVLLTGAFLAPLFKDLPQATLGAIVIVAVSGFWRVGELRRFARLRRSAILLALVALAGVLVLGVLQGLVVAAGLSLILVIKRLSRPSVGTLARDPATGVWGRADRNPGWERPSGVTVVRSDGPLFYANAVAVKEQILATARAAGARAVVIDTSGSTDLDVETVDALTELANALAAEGVELRLAGVRRPAAVMLSRSGVAERVTIAPTIDAAVHHPPG